MTAHRQHLNNAQSVEQLKAELQARYPLINPSTLAEVVILGAAEEGRRLCELCQEYNIKVVHFCDDHPERQGKKVAGCLVEPTSCLDSIDKSIPIVIASHRVIEVMKRLRNKGHKAVAPFALLQTLAPEHFAPHMFYEDWVESLFLNRDKIEKLVSLLEDEKSLAVLDAIIGYRLTLDPEVMRDIIDWELYGSKDLLALSDSEIYIDGGSFDGDTIRGFIERVDNKFKRIIGFEPDTNTFNKLKQNFNHEPGVELINKGLYSHPDTLCFDNAGTRGSIFTEESESTISVPVTSVDEVLQGSPVTFIKMNIEGAEIPALKGSAKSIEKYQPKLGISIYHRPTDLWEIPFLIKELHSDYKFYLRQHDGGVIESVVYAI